jgi:hypothetical protein
MTEWSVTSQMALDWAEYYVNVLAKNGGNTSAYGRAELMQYVAKLLE